METRHFKKGDITKAYNCDGYIILATIEIEGVWISNPTVQMLESTGWEEFTPNPIPVHEPTREEKINLEIREKYSENDEWMIQRRYASNPTLYAEQFYEYNEYVESIIAKYPEGDE